MKGITIRSNGNALACMRRMFLCCSSNLSILNPRFQNFYDNSVLTCLPDLLLSFQCDLQTLLGIDNYCSHLLITARELLFDLTILFSVLLKY